MADDAKETGRVKSGKWWKTKQPRKRYLTKSIATSNEPERRLVQSSKLQITKMSQSDNALLKHCGTARVKKYELEETTSVPTQSSLVTSQQNVFKSRIPRLISLTRDNNRKRSRSIRNPQILDDLFISKITVNDELKFLRRDLALGWLEKPEARKRIEDVKGRFNVDLCSYLTNYEYQQIYGENDDESEWEEDNYNPIDCWS